MIAANQGRYNLDTQKVAIDGPVQGRGRRRLSARDQRRDRRPEAAPAGEPGPSRAQCGSDSSRRASFAPTLATEPSCSTAVLA